MIKRYIRRFPYALAGIWHAWREDFSYRSQVLTIIPTVVLFALWQWPLSQSELLFLALATALILITELQNTAFERALDRIHPERHEAIGKSKDMAAGATLTAGIFLLFVMAFIVLF